MTDPMITARAPRSNTTLSEQHRLVGLAFEMFAQHGYDGTTLAMIAREADMPVARMTTHFADKFALLSAFGQMMDDEVLAETEADSLDEPLRDRLFDIYIRRFEAMAPYKPGIKAVANAARMNPLIGLHLLTRLGQSVATMAEACGLSASPPVGPARVTALSALWLNTARIWYDDDSRDLAPTMAALDKGLDKIEMIAGSLPKGLR